ncbi:cystatin-like [Danio aesculapii]|uniref:cystatin-like n=1 Tax=Danio aesculapii TaxID=1142201 RepID=UPI0024BF7F0D|nr:cystatin-like [Danio aesculapii]
MFLKAIVALLVVNLAVSSAGLVGGPVDAKMDKESKKALKFAMTQYNKLNGDVFLCAVSKIIKLQKQVVAGIKYIFTVNVARTTCRKGRDEKSCPIQKNPALARVKQCRIAVWIKSWEKFIKVTENSCL